jgi:hypothetical protein
MNNPELFRPKSGYWIAGTIFFATIGIVSQVILDRNIYNSLIAITWGSLFCALAYLFFIHPRIKLFDEGIEITNPFLKYTIGWTHVSEIEARYCMSVLVNGKNIYAWAAPAPGRYHSRNLHASEIKGLKVGLSTLIRPGESPRSHSGVASHLAKLRLEKFRLLDTPVADEPSVIINKIGICTLAACLGCIFILYAFHL